MNQNDNNKGDLMLGLISFILPFGLVVMSYFLFHEFKVVDYILLAIGGIDLILFLSNLKNRK